MMFIAIPFVVVRALRFNANMSSWRNVRFNFVGEAGGAFGAYIGWPILGMFSLGFALPFAWFKQAEFGVDNHQLGSTPFKLSAAPKDFYILALILFVYAIAVMTLFAMLTSTLGEESLVLIPLLLLAYFMGFSLFSALRFQLIYNNLQLGENVINNKLNVGSYLIIAITNGFFMALTLGLYYPWAKIRITNYLIESLRLHAVNVDEFVNEATTQQSAFGEEFGEAFDLGIGV